MEYTVNLRKAVLVTSRFKRTKKAVKALKEFVMRHTKAKIVKISQELNKFIWKRGGRKPPTKFTIVVTKEGDTAFVDLKK
ncbi:NEQ364 [Nanoarchaeum equitans Kin4-M]|uniref:Large ribosomal subunit protein eL31 n=1 Tax=Nanoarchaeum equitans (strain Kin4-M) TaxID=228908 RepID=Q74MC9_NANEQ|nr:NEQ364 [Nanoarchaeum equitans Kin4-M]